MIEGKFVPEASVVHDGRQLSVKTCYILGAGGVVLTIFVAVAVVYYWEYIQNLEGYGYVGALIISILGGATIVVPVPMLAVILALGGVVKHPWMIGLAAGLGETIGALTIYMTGRGAGVFLYNVRPGRMQKAYERLMGFMERRGPLTLFLLSSVLNPFFYPAALAAGALRFGLLKYSAICWAGKTIKGLTIAYAGYWGLRGILRYFGVPL